MKETHTEFHLVSGSIESVVVCINKLLSEGRSLFGPPFSLPFGIAQAMVKRSTPVVGFIELPTKIGPVHSSVKVSGSIVKVEKEDWDNEAQDWRATVTMSTGERVRSSYYYRHPASPWNS